ncbi:MAG: hypothetical protein WBA31_06140 [Candidatus Dormiibacterota bacterium]
MKVQPSIATYRHVNEPGALRGGPWIECSAGRIPCQLSNSS